ncbi:MAG: BON domain-containing protein [Pirellulales bacterium]|nr:BON domain-containing protein [Pirellulales bacterium]
MWSLPRHRTLLLTVAAISAWATSTRPAAAQMFGQRTVGQTLTPQAQPGSTGASNPAGMVGGLGANMGSALGPNPRFMRNNRDPNAFVGRDQQDAGGFVGSTQAIGGAVGTSLGDLLPARDANVNRPRFEAPVTRQQLYRPRLVLHEQLRLPPAAAPLPVSQTERALARRQLAQRVRVQVSNRTAILEGVVASEHDRLLAAELARLEPGVAAVENRLRLAAPLPEPVAGPSPGPGSVMPSPDSPDRRPRQGPREF